MAVADQSYSSRRDTVTFLVCLSLAAVIRLSPLPFAEGLASGIRESLLVPFLQLQTQTQRWQAQRREFATIVARHDSAVVVASQVAVLNAENARLRAILGLRGRMPVHHVAADVLHQSLQAGGTTLIVSAGAKDGVRRRAPVVAVGGLVGNVQTVDDETSVVYAWTHPDFRVSATALGDSVVGIVAPILGEGATMTLELRGVSYRGDIPDGTPVVTSEMGGVYPRGITVGYVRGVIDQREGWLRSFLLEPAVHPAVVSHVLILLGQAGDLSPAFERR